MNHGGKMNWAYSTQSCSDIAGGMALFTSPAQPGPERLRITIATEQKSPTYLRGADKI